jgi:hypothetical protein
MDVSNNLAVVAMADRKVAIYNLNQGVVPYRQTMSVLHKQTRCITAFPTADGFCIGSIEGRVGVQYIDPKEEQQGGKNFSFKCHRDLQLIHAVNDIKFHPQYGRWPPPLLHEHLCFRILCASFLPLCSLPRVDTIALLLGARSQTSTPCRDTTLFELHNSLGLL